MDTKDILLNEVQRKTHKTVLTHNLRSEELNCIVTGKDKSNFVIFKISENNEAVWKFSFLDFRDGFSSNLICIFVNKNLYEEYEYHVIEISKLLEINSITPNEFVRDKNKKYYFYDADNKYKDNWNIFK